MLQATSFALQVLQVSALIIIPIKVHFFCTTPRDRREAEGFIMKLHATLLAHHRLAALSQMTYVSTVSGLVVVVLIGLTYAIVQPLSTIFSTLFFAAAYFCYKYQVRLLTLFHLSILDSSCHSVCMCTCPSLRAAATTLRLYLTGSTSHSSSAN